MTDGATESTTTDEPCPYCDDNRTYVVHGTLHCQRCGEIDAETGTPRFIEPDDTDDDKPGSSGDCGGRLSFDQLLPPARTYAREEWRQRTWFGRMTLPGEVLLIPVLRGIPKIQRRLPGVYRGQDDAGIHGESG